MTTYPKRLIEVDLPIKRISAHARREKSIGHISSLHIWWARRPLAACRAVICAALWPDPADENCPNKFREVARRHMSEWAQQHLGLLGPESYQRFVAIQKNPKKLDDGTELRQALLDFIADFANWDNSMVPEYLATSRALTQSAHEALGSAPGTKPLVVDPFAGGGSIPLEALRVGADTFASDLNPIPVLLNKVLLEYIPKYGQRLADEVRKCGKRIGEQAAAELSAFYPDSADGSTPIAYLWARTIHCEGPRCGADIPIIRSGWLAKAGANTAFFEISTKTVRGKSDILLSVKAGLPKDGRASGTVKRGSVSCPVCDYTISRQRVEAVAKDGKLGERMIAVILTRAGHSGRTYRTPTDRDEKAFHNAGLGLQKMGNRLFGDLDSIPDEPLPYLRSIFNVHVYGVTKWSQLFNQRQLLASITFAKLVRKLAEDAQTIDEDKELTSAVVTILALAVDRQINALNRTCYWNPTGPKMQAGFARQAIPMFWDYCEANPFGGSVGSWESMIKCVCASFDVIDTAPGTGTSVQSSATTHPLPDNSADAVITDPPYYDAVPYADLSDFFYVWLKRMLGKTHSKLFASELSPKKLEIVQLAERNIAYSYKTKENFERLMTVSLAEGRRVAKPFSTSVVVFAHQSTSGWEAMLSALIGAGWTVTASWPIDTEMPTRVRAQGSAVLASSIHLVCRPREKADVSLRTDDVGDWRDVLAELPKRIHAWMPRLAEEGVVGADAIFACLGPALEVFSRYARVEKPGGETVTLKEYLVHVWAAIAREALNMIFAGADATGFEEDARLTAMWLWTLSTGRQETKDGTEELEETDDDEDGGKKGKKAGGHLLEYDAVRKIAQGLGAHLEELTHTIEVMGEKARLLPVAERTQYLFGKDDADSPKRRKKRDDQMTLKGIEREVEEAAEEGGWGEKTAPKAGSTVLDRVHQAMILFAAGRGEAMKRFLVEEGIGNDNRFWKLAQAFSALYPSKSDEKRWVDGVLARKKGLGF